jgi:hypothetical protein
MASHSARGSNYNTARSSSSGSSRPADGGTGNTGIAAFFQVAPGLYVLHVERAGYTFPDTLVPVRGGTISADLIQGTGIGAAVPLAFSGTVSGQAPFPMAFGVTMPLPGYTVTAELDDGTRLDATTDATGTYALPLPAIGHWFDLTATAPGYAPLRSDQRCSGLDTALTFNVGDAIARANALAYYLGTTPEAPDSGLISASVTHGTAGMAGATLSTTPALPGPFYGGDPSRRASCALWWRWESWNRPAPRSIRRPPRLTRTPPSPPRAPRWRWPNRPPPWATLAA